MSETRPALTPEEWDGQLGGGVYGPDDAHFYFHDGTDSGLWVGGNWSDGLFEGRDRHALAAAALHGQPFGFTWEMVDRLRREASLCGEEAYHHKAAIKAEDDLTEIADRIAALLPPRDDG